MKSFFAVIFLSSFFTVRSLPDPTYPPAVSPVTPPSYTTPPYNTIPSLPTPPRPQVLPNNSSKPPSNYGKPLISNYNIPGGNNPFNRPGGPGYPGGPGGDNNKPPTYGPGGENDIKPPTYGPGGEDDIKPPKPPTYGDEDDNDDDKPIYDPYGPAGDNNKLPGKPDNYNDDYKPERDYNGKCVNIFSTPKKVLFETNDTRNLVSHCTGGCVLDNKKVRPDLINSVVCKETVQSHGTEWYNQWDVIPAAGGCKLKMGNLGCLEALSGNGYDTEIPLRYVNCNKDCVWRVTFHEDKNCGVSLCNRSGYCIKHSDGKRFSVFNSAFPYAIVASRQKDDQCLYPRPIPPPKPYQPVPYRPSY